MKLLRIHITPHDMNLNSTLVEFIHKKVSSLSRFAGDIIAAEVVLRGPSGTTNLYSVSARLAVPGRDVKGGATHQNLYGAINRLVARLGRLSRKRKTRLARTSQRPDKKKFKRTQASNAFAFAF